MHRDDSDRGAQQRHDAIQALRSLGCAREWRASGRRRAIRPHDRDMVPLLSDLVGRS